MSVKVYTAVFGRYDALLPAVHPSLCFTDGQMDPVSGWEYETCFAGCDPKWANRRCKILAHDHVDSEYSIYHDGNVSMLIHPDEAVARWLRDTDIAVFAHPSRDCIYDEAAACVKIGKAPVDIVTPHMQRYLNDGYPIRNGLAACWVLIRRHTPAIARLNQRWWAEYKRGAKRDQLSFNYACWKEGVEYTTIPGNLWEGTSADFERREHKRAQPMLKTNWQTAYGQQLHINERRYLKSAASEAQAEFGKETIIVNIGVFQCASMYCLRAGAAMAHLIGVDIRACTAPIDSGLRANFIIADSAVCHTQVAAPIHVLFIDGDHRYDAVKKDLAFWSDKVPVNGKVILHDYAPLAKHMALLPELEGIRRATNEWFDSEKWERLTAPDSLAAFRRL